MSLKAEFDREFSPAFGRCVDLALHEFRDDLGREGR
jgi:hypothetical protein